MKSLSPFLYKHIMTLFFIMITLSSTILLAFPAMAHSQKLNLFYGTLPPFNFPDKTGKVTGISVDILNRIMDAMGEPIEGNKIEEIPLARALRYTEKNKNTILFSIARTSERENKYKWVGPIYNLKLGLVSKRKNNLKIKDAKDLSEYKIAVIRDSAPQSILAHKFHAPTDELQLVSDDIQQFNMLERGRADAITQSNTGAPSLIRQAGLSVSDFEMSFVMMDLDLYFCLNKGFSDKFVSQMQFELDKMKLKNAEGKSESDTIIEKYLDREGIYIKGECLNSP